MKKSDIAMIILIASISIGASFLIVRAIPGLSDSNKPVKVKSVDKYSSNISDIDTKVFNQNATNPTVQVTIGNSTSTDDQDQGN